MSRIPSVIANGLMTSMRDTQRDLARMWTRRRAPVMLVNLNPDDGDMYAEYLGTWDSSP
jgi:hypothetical protein